MGERGMLVTSMVRVSLTGVLSTSTVLLPGFNFLLGLKQATGSCSLLFRDGVSIPQGSLPSGSSPPSTWGTRPVSTTQARISSKLLEVVKSGLRCLFSYLYCSHTFITTSYSPEMPKYF